MSKLNATESDLKRKEKEELSDDEDTTTALSLPAKRSKDCPYLDSINRKVLDFGKFRQFSDEELESKFSLVDIYN